MYRQREPNYPVTTTLKPHLWHIIKPEVSKKRVKWSELLERGAVNYIRAKRGQKDQAEIYKKLHETYKSEAHKNARAAKKLLVEINTLRTALGKPRLTEQFLNKLYEEEERNANIQEENQNNR